MTPDIKRLRAETDFYLDPDDLAAERAAVDAEIERLRGALQRIADGEGDRGCADHSCIVCRPREVGTNGGRCRCAPDEIRNALHVARFFARRILKGETP